MAYPSLRVDIDLIIIRTVAYPDLNCLLAYCRYLLQLIVC